MNKNGKLLPASVGTYRIVRKEELTVEQLATLRSVRKERVEARLRELVGSGRVAVSQVAGRYHALMAELERDLTVGNMEKREDHHEEQESS